MLLSVSLRVQSRVLSVEQLTKLLGAAPSHSVNVGSPVSTRDGDGPRQQVTTWTRSSTTEGETLAEHLPELLPQLSRLHHARKDDEGLTVDLVLMLEAAPMGAMVELDAEQVRLLSDCACGVVVDAYDAG